MPRLAYLCAPLLLAVGLIAAANSNDLWGTAATQQAGDGFKPGKLSAEEIANLQPGMTLRFLDSGGTSKSLDARSIRLAALHVPADTPQSTMLPAGRFAASLTGLLKLELNSDRLFKLVGSGNAELFINNKVVAKMKDGAATDSQMVALVKGYNKVEVRCTNPAKGEVTVRVYWKADEFGWEPLPPDRLFTRQDDADLVAGVNVREGRLLFATLGCSHCHALPGTVTLDQCRMPELRHQAPSLANAGNRFSADWLAQWIADPRALRPEATMPRLLHGPTAAKDGEDLVAYLVSLKDGQAFAKTKQSDALTEWGEKYFISLGCVACHNLKGPAEKDDYQRLSLHFVGAKFTPGALEAFLRAPHQHYPWSRMPDFKLARAKAKDDDGKDMFVDEPEALTSYLLTEAKGTIDGAKRNPGDRANGAKLFDSIGCSQCHITKADAVLSKPTQPFPKNSAKGCLADNAGGRGHAPDFVLTPQQLLGLRAFLATDGMSLTRETAAEFSLRQMKLLQCNACHTRDDSPSRWWAVLSEEGAGLQPEYLPRLTWTGEKLHPEWTEKLLAGVHDHRARPWLKARMPAFPTRAALLSVGLSHEHGFAVNEDPRPAPDSKLVPIGEKLIPQDGGFNCINCHDTGSRKALAPFDSPGINLRDAAQRLRYEFYARWMMEPTRADPTTKMTKFTEDGGAKTKITSVFGGDARLQFDAVWQYMQTLPEKK